MTSCRWALTLEEVVDIFRGAGHAHSRHVSLSRSGGSIVSDARRSIPGPAGIVAPGALGPANIVSGARRPGPRYGQIDRRGLIVIDASAGRSRAGCRLVHGELLPLHGEYESAGRRAPLFSGRVLDARATCKSPRQCMCPGAQGKGDGYLQPAGSWNRQ